MADLYTTDFYAWTQEQANFLRLGKIDHLDWVNLVEEVESLGRQQKQELKNRLGVLLGYLLKWQYQPSHRSKSWRYTIQEQRLQLLDLLDQNPSLQAHQDEVLAKGYQLGLLLLGRETPINPKELPSCCPFTLDQILDASYPSDLESM